MNAYCSPLKKKFWSCETRLCDWIKIWIKPLHFSGTWTCCNALFPPLQTCSSGRRCAALPSRPHTLGSPAIRCGQTGAELYYLCHNSCLQDGANVYVRSVSGKKGIWVMHDLINRGSFWLDYHYFIKFSLSFHVVPKQQWRFYTVHTWWCGCCFW